MPAWQSHWQPYMLRPQQKHHHVWQMRWCFGSWAVAFFPYTFRFPSFWQWLIFVSSVNRTLFHNSTSFFFCMLLWTVIWPFCFWGSPGVCILCQILWLMDMKSNLGHLLCSYKGIFLCNANYFLLNFLVFLCTCFFFKMCVAVVKMKSTTFDVCLIDFCFFEYYFNSSLAWSALYSSCWQTPPQSKLPTLSQLWARYKCFCAWLYTKY